MTKVLDTFLIDLDWKRCDYLFYFIFYIIN